MFYSEDELVEQLQAIRPEHNNRYSWSDLGNGNLMADIYVDRLRYCPERNQWFYYDGKRWTLDVQAAKVMEAAKTLGEALIRYSSGLKIASFPKHTRNMRRDGENGIDGRR